MSFHVHKNGIPNRTVIDWPPIRFQIISLQTVVLMHPLFFN